MKASEEERKEWHRCYKCQAAFRREQVGGACPVSGIHATWNVKLFVTTSGVEGGDGEVEKWRYCKDCKGLALGEGVCSAGDKHTLDESEFFVLAPFSDPVREASEEKEWKHCSKCQLLAFDGWNACSGGGAHVSVASPCYTMIYAADRHGSPDGEHGWNICSGCYCLVYNSERIAGDQKACPEGGNHMLCLDRDYIVKIKKTQETLLEDGWARCEHCSVLHRSTGEVGTCLDRRGVKHSSKGSKHYWLLCAKNSDQELVNGGWEWRERTAEDHPPEFDGF